MVVTACAPVAQLDRALVCGTRGRAFESRRVYQKYVTQTFCNSRRLSEVSSSSLEIASCFVCGVRRASNRGFSGFTSSWAHTSAFLVLRDDNLVLAHIYGKRTWFFHEFLHIFRHNLPADAKFIFAPATLLVFGAIGKNVELFPPYPLCY
jgi:hypothetical protein